MLEKEFQKKIKFLLFVQAGLNRSDLSYQQVIDAMIQADLIPVAEISDRYYEAGVMAIDFVSWQVHLARLPEWDYLSGKPDWYKREWTDLDWQLC